MRVRVHVLGVCAIRACGDVCDTECLRACVWWGNEVTGQQGAERVQTTGARDGRQTDRQTDRLMEDVGPVGRRGEPQEMPRQRMGV